MATKAPIIKEYDIPIELPKKDEPTPVPIAITIHTPEPVVVRK